jgi:hypothetical protein
MPVANNRFAKSQTISILGIEASNIKGALPDSSSADGLWILPAMVDAAELTASHRLTIINSSGSDLI